MRIEQLPAHFSETILVAVLLATLCGPAHATTVVVVVHKDGIAVLADSKSAQPEGVVSPICRDSIDATKVFNIQQRFAIAYLGLNCFSPAVVVVPPMRSDLFESRQWTCEMQENLPKDVSFDQLVEIIKAKFSELIPMLQFAITSGSWGERTNVMENFDDLITFVIAGYENGSPRLSVVGFYINWATKTVLTPYIIPIRLNPLELPLFRFVGVTQAAYNIFDSRSYAYKQGMSIYPKIFKRFLSSGDPSFDDSIIVGRLMVEVEEKVSPRTVAGAIRGVKITPNGKATELANSAPLPQSRSPKTTKNK